MLLDRLYTSHRQKNKPFSAGDTQENMTPFRFSPIQDTAQMLAAITYIHGACHTLCKQFMGHYLPVAGNIGIFCHSDNEYDFLTTLREKITDTTDAVYGKYFRLYEPIVIPTSDIAPAATYTYLYIRKPDANKPQVGDIDFFVTPGAFTALKQALRDNRNTITLDRPDLDLIEVYDPAIDALSYIGDKKWQ